MLHELLVFAHVRDPLRRDVAASRLVAWWTPVLTERCRRWLSGLADGGDAAQDVVQEASWRALRAARRCRASSDAGLGAWVVRIGQRLALDALRSPGAIGAGVPLDDDYAAPEHDAAPDVAPSVRAALEATLAGLLPHQHSLLDMRAASLSWSALARHFQTTPSAIRRRHDRAMASARRTSVAPCMLEGPGSRPRRSR